MFGNPNRLIDSTSALPHEEPICPEQLQDSPLRLPDHRDEPTPWTMELQKSLGPEIDHTQEIKSLINLKSPRNQSRPSPDEF